MALGVAGSNPVTYPIFNPHANQSDLEPQGDEELELTDGKAGLEPSEMLEYIRQIKRYAVVKPRTYWYEFSFFIIIAGFRQRFCFGNRPEDLACIDTISQKALERHQAYLNRLERFPLDKAEYYLRLRESHAANTVRALARITGEDWSYIARILRTLNLPEPVKDFLKSNKNNPSILQFFHLRKLLDIIRQGEECLQLIRFRELMQEFEENFA